jgi:hypothetical protein
MFSSGALIETSYLMVVSACASLAIFQTQLQKEAQDKLEADDADEMEDDEFAELDSYSDRNERVAVAR